MREPEGPPSWRLFRERVRCTGPQVMVNDWEVESEEDVELPWFSVTRKAAVKHLSTGILVHPSYDIGYASSSRDACAGCPLTDITAEPRKRSKDSSILSVTITEQAISKLKVEAILYKCDIDG